MSGQTRTDRELKRAEFVNRELQAEIRELRAKIAAIESEQVDANHMVPIYVSVPTQVYERLRDQAEEFGQPAAELASLWLWRAVREFSR